MDILVQDSLLLSGRSVALKSLEILKSREAKSDVVRVRVDYKTVLVMSREKAIRKGYIEGEIIEEQKCRKKRSKSSENK